MSDFAKVEQSLREEMTRIASSFFQRGYATGSAGNLSLLLPDGNLLATPTGSCLGNLDPQRLSKVAADGEWLSGDKPSKEVLFHLALYRNNPRCKAVVHLHSTWSTALSCLQGLDSSNVIRPFTPYVVMRMGNVPLVPYYRPGDKRIAQDLAELAALLRKVQRYINVMFYAIDLAIPWEGMCQAYNQLMKDYVPAGREGAVDVSDQ